MLDTKQLKKGKGTGVINKKDSWGFALRVSGYRLRVKKNRSLFTENANVGISGKWFAI